MKGLTPRQQEILDFIQLFIIECRYSPSYREIMDHFSFTSPGTVYKFIQTLKRKGVITDEKHSPRSITPLQALPIYKESADLQLPLIGNLSIGYPLELFIQPQMIPVTPSLVHNPDSTYILQTQGDSLKEEGIFDGDLLLIEARQDIQPGEIILGLINQHDTLLKRFYPEGQNIRLESQYSAAPPLTIRYEHISIQGVLISLMRVY
jgi:repressor LexA